MEFAELLTTDESGYSADVQLEASIMLIDRQVHPFLYNIFNPLGYNASFLGNDPMQ